MQSRPSLQNPAVLYSLIDRLSEACSERPVSNRYLKQPRSRIQVENVDTSLQCLIPMEGSRSLGDNFPKTMVFAPKIGDSTCFNLAFLASLMPTVVNPRGHQNRMTNYNHVISYRFQHRILHNLVQCWWLSINFLQTTNFAGPLVIIGVLSPKVRWWRAQPN